MQENQFHPTVATLYFRKPIYGEFGYQHLINKILVVTTELKEKPLSYAIDPSNPCLWAHTDTPRGRELHTLGPKLPIVVGDNPYSKLDYSSRDIAELPIAYSPWTVLYNGVDTFDVPEYSGMAKPRSSNDKTYVITPKISKKEFLDEALEWSSIDSKECLHNLFTILAEIRYDSCRFIDIRKLIKPLLTKALRSQQMYEDWLIEVFDSASKISKTKATDFIQMEDEEIFQWFLRFNQRTTRVPRFIEEESLKEVIQIDTGTKLAHGSVAYTGFIDIDDPKTHQDITGVVIYISTKALSSFARRTNEFFFAIKIAPGGRIFDIYNVTSLSHQGSNKVIIREENIDDANTIIEALYSALEPKTNLEPYTPGSILGIPLKFIDEAIDFIANLHQTKFALPHDDKKTEISYFRLQSKVDVASASSTLSATIAIPKLLKSRILNEISLDYVRSHSSYDLTVEDLKAIEEKLFSLNLGKPLVRSKTNMLKGERTISVAKNLKILYDILEEPLKSYVNFCLGSTGNKAPYLIMKENGYGHGRNMYIQFPSNIQKVIASYSFESIHEVLGSTGSVKLLMSARSFIKYYDLLKYYGDSETLTKEYCKALVSTQGTEETSVGSSTTYAIFEKMMPSDSSLIKNGISDIGSKNDVESLVCAFGVFQVLVETMLYKYRTNKVLLDLNSVPDESSKLVRDFDIIQNFMESSQDPGLTLIKSIYD
jgi:hypothetical protein